MPFAAGKVRMRDGQQETKQMKKDLSYIFYQRYFSGSDRRIQMVLKSGRRITGVIIAFVRGDQYSHDPYITRWHITAEKDKMSLGRDAFGFLIGEVIHHKEIARIICLQDGSEWVFDTPFSS